MTPPAIRIRPATAADAPTMSALFKELGHPTPASEIPARLEQVIADAGAVLVAEADGRALGLMCLARVMVIHAGPVAYITALVVTEAARGRGVGRALVDAAWRWAREQGCRRLSVTSNEHRADAHAFYPRCGLPYTGRRFSAAVGSPPERP